MSELHTPIRDVIYFLLEKFNIHDERFTEEMIAQFNFSEKTIENWLAGKVMPAKTGRARLAEYFRGYSPKINPSDFKLSAITFKKKFDEAYTHEKLNTIEIPLNGAELSMTDLNNGYRQLRGVYRTYRYAFENTGKIAVEFLIIKGFDEKSHLIKATIIGGSNTSSSSIMALDDKGLKIEEFSGRVLCFGSTYYLFFTSETDRDQNNTRMRMVVLEKPERHRSYDNFYYGIIVARSSYFGAPASARFFLEKITTGLSRNLSIEQLKNDVEITTQDQIPKNILTLISNDIKNNHMGVRKDYILRTSMYDMAEILRP